MTVEKGQEWGSVGALGSDAPIVASDAEVAAAWREGASEVGLLPGGDLARTVSAAATTGELRAGHDRRRLPIDLGLVTDGDGREEPFAAHLVIRRWSWVGDVTGVLNTPFLGRWNVAPRAHPNDGRFDELHSSLRRGQKLEARRRLASGTHLPHPDLVLRRRAEGALTRARGDLVFIDGRREPLRGPLTYRVVADALTIVI